MYTRQSRLFEEDPEMRAAVRFLERRLDAVLLKLVLQLQQIDRSVLIIGVDCNPLGPLRVRVDRINTEREFAGQVLLNGFRTQRGWYFPALRLRPVVVMSSVSG
jgi:hypothetical protein